VCRSRKTDQLFRMSASSLELCPRAYLLRAGSPLGARSHNILDFIDGQSKSRDGDIIDGQVRLILNLGAIAEHISRV
jgi:hypothetical protein